MVYRLAFEEDRVCTQLLCNKYLHSKNLSHVTTPNNSPFWKGLVRTKVALSNMGKFIIWDGQTTHFSEDVWIGDSPLTL